MEPNVSTPPRAAVWILGWLLSETTREGLVGDLTEEFTLRVSVQPVPNAARWYWRQVLRSFPQLLWGAFRRGQWRATLGAAVSAYVFVMIIEAFLQLALVQHVAPRGVLRWVISIPVGLTAMTLGGFLAAWMRRGAAGTLAVLSSLVIIVLMIKLGAASPRWYQVTFLILGPVAILTGGALLRRRQERSQTSVG